MTAIAILHRDSILDQLATGKRLSDIAPVLGVSVNAISKVLKDDPDYHAAMESSFEVRIDSAEDAILNAPGQVDVSRARAYHDAIRWRAGVECTKWQAKSQVQVDMSVTVLLAPRDVGATVGATPIDGECDVVDNQQVSSGIR